MKQQIKYEVSYSLSGQKYVLSGTFNKKDHAIAAANELFRDFVDNWAFVKVEILRRVRHSDE
jgi:hypothetical protein